MSLRGGRFLVAVLGVVALTAAAFASAASAQGGQSTPAVIVTAQNPGTSPLGSDLRITLSAHSEASALEDVSCRPQDNTLRCWGSLVLRIPAFDGLSVTGFEVHRVAVGDTSCDDDEGGCEGHEDEGGCEGHEDEGGCEGHDGEAVALDAGEAVHARVSGVAVLVDPGASGLPPGTAVQVQIDLTDNGAGRYGDRADVQVRRFVPGPDKPLIYDTGEQTIQQVQVHFRAGSN